MATKKPAMDSETAQEPSTAPVLSPEVIAVLDRIASSVNPAETIKAWKEQEGKPTRAQLQKKAQAKWQAKQDAEAFEVSRAAKIAACGGHIHPDNGKSRMHKFPVGQQLAEVGLFPKGAGKMVCSNCGYSLQNYEVVDVRVPIEDGFYVTKQEVRLIHNPEFDRWFALPTVSQGTLFGG